MSKIIIIANKEFSEKYIFKFIEDHNISTFNITNFVDEIKIDQVREIKKRLAMVTAEEVLYVFQNRITIEAQNALLKNIEEVDERVHFIFCVEERNQLLPTVRSRCLEVLLSPESQKDIQLAGIVEGLGKSPDSWREIDLISQFLQNDGLHVLLGTLRHLLLENLSDYSKTIQYYEFCRNAIYLYSLTEKNNVSARSVVENIFGIPRRNIGYEMTT